MSTNVCYRWLGGKMTTLYIILSVGYIAISGVLVALILAQKKKSSGLGTMSGMGSAPQTYWDKNKGRSLEGSLHRGTKILGAIFIILSLVLTVI